jgi:radical SAM superfamily enzyme YgiQ (UPF0313 family)
MRILLIAPATGNWRRTGRRALFNGRTFRFSLLSLLTIAAETPPEHDVRIIDEQVEEVPFDADADLVGVTCMTALAPRAYDIAARFRARGIPVVLGGMHPSLCTEEALGHADAVVRGEVEGVWQRVLADATSGCLTGLYQAPVPPDLAGLRRPPRHLLNSREYATINAVQATRGCPHTCDFCSIRAFHPTGQRQRPVAEVVAEVAALPGRFVLFVDDHLAGNRAYAEELFKAMTPLRKLWVTQCTLSIGQDERFVELAARAGCFGIFSGIESFSQEALGGVRKRFNRVERYRDAIACLHAHGIGVEAGIVFGFDQDTPGVFETTLEAVEQLGIDAVQASIMTPLPGTPLFERMGPRLRHRDWSLYDLHHCVFEPAGMTAEQLEAGHDWFTREFYRPDRIARRLARHAMRPRGLETVRYVAALNAGYYGRVTQWHLRGWNPARSSASPVRRPRLARA